MTKQARSRVPWTCPDCGRDYQLSAGRTPPPLCKQCTRRNQKAARITNTPAPAAAPPTSAPPVIQPSQPSIPVPRERKELPADVESHIARQERERLLADVANISRTMTFFRRLVWAMVIMMVLNFLLIGAAFLYSMKQMSSLDGLLLNKGGAAVPQQQGQRLPGNQQELPPGIAEKMKPIQDYFDQLNQALEETR